MSRHWGRLLTQQQNPIVAKMALSPKVPFGVIKPWVLKFSCTNSRWNFNTSSLITSTSSVSSVDNGVSCTSVKSVQWHPARSWQHKRHQLFSSSPKHYWALHSVWPDVVIKRLMLTINFSSLLNIYKQTNENNRNRNVLYKRLDILL